MSDISECKEKFNKYLSIAEDRRLVDLEDEFVKTEAYRENEKNLDAILDKIREIDPSLGGEVEHLAYHLMNISKYFFYRNGFVDGTTLHRLLGGKYNTRAKLHECEKDNVKLCL